MSPCQHSLNCFCLVFQTKLFFNFSHYYSILDPFFTKENKTWHGNLSRLCRLFYVNIDVTVPGNFRPWWVRRHRSSLWRDLLCWEHSSDASLSHVRNGAEQWPSLQGEKAQRQRLNAVITGSIRLVCESATDNGVFNRACLITVKTLAFTQETKGFFGSWRRITGSRISQPNEWEKRGQEMVGKWQQHTGGGLKAKGSEIQ